MTLGLIFGSFDPIHYGHLSMVEQAFGAGCNEIMMVVQPDNAFKATGVPTALADRLAMAKLAVKGTSSVSVAPLDPDIALPHSITATLQSLKEKDSNRELVLLLGNDLAKTLPEWKDYETITSLCRIMTVPRTGSSISSSFIRELVGKGDSIEGYAPPAVKQYILSRHLYS
jgi:nicotinate-nucleotide adenylyltransferase